MAVTVPDHYLRILRAVRLGGEVTRRELVRLTDLSPGAVNRAIRELRVLGLIGDAGRSRSNGGRPPDTLSLRPDAGYAVGLDLDGERQRAVLADLSGRIASSLDEPMRITTDREEILSEAVRLFRRVVAASGVREEAVLGVGVSLHAIVDPLDGTVYCWPDTPEWSEAWTDFRFRDELAARLRGPHVVVDDIVRALGAMEGELGAGRGEESFVYVWADRGVGSALMLGGEPYLGPARVAGEIGHIKVTSEPLPCSCGNTGCLETVISTESILRRARQRLGESALLSAASSRGAELSISDVLEDAELGDKLSYRLLTEAGEYLGVALATVLNLLGVELMVVGGRLASSDVFLDAARHALRLRALPQLSRRIRLERSLMGELAGCRAAASLALGSLFGRGSPNLVEMAIARREAAASSEGR